MGRWNDSDSMYGFKCVQGNITMSDFGSLSLEVQECDIKHVLLLGRVVSGKGGNTLLARCRHVLRDEFPNLASRIVLDMPDEKSRRVGQSFAAASLPKIK